MIFLATGRMSTAQQFVNNGFNHWYTQAGTEGVIIGTNTGFAPSALTIRGDNMNTPTGEVFRTECGAGGTNQWRMMRGGVEIGHIFNQGNAFRGCAEPMVTERHREWRALV